MPPRDALGRTPRSRRIPRTIEGGEQSPSALQAGEALECSFLTSVDLARCPPSDEPEVAFAGRSNAGKSSTLNRLAGRKQLARVRKTPCRAQLINFFQVATGEPWTQDPPRRLGPRHRRLPEQPPESDGPGPSHGRPPPFAALCCPLTRP